MFGIDNDCTAARPKHTHPTIHATCCVCAWMTHVQLTMHMLLANTFRLSTAHSKIRNFEKKLRLQTPFQLRVTHQTLHLHEGVWQRLYVVAWKLDMRDTHLNNAPNSGRKTMRLCRTSNPCTFLCFKTKWENNLLCQYDNSSDQIGWKHSSIFNFQWSQTFWYFSFANMRLALDESRQTVQHQKVVLLSTLKSLSF